MSKVRIWNALGILLLSETNMAAAVAHSNSMSRCVAEIKRTPKYCIACPVKMISIYHCLFCCIPCIVVQGFAVVTCFWAYDVIMESNLSGFHPESLGRGWAGTSPKSLVIGRQPRHGSGNLPASGAFLAVAIVQ